MAGASTALSPLTKVVAFKWLHDGPGRKRNNEILFCLLRDDGRGGEDLAQGGPTYFSRITQKKKKNHHVESQGSWSIIRDGLVLSDFACCPGMPWHWDGTFHRVQSQGRQMVWENFDGNVYRSITFLGKFLVPSAGITDLESGLRSLAYFLRHRSPDEEADWDSDECVLV